MQKVFDTPYCLYGGITDMMETNRDRLQLLQEMFGCCYNISFWEYDKQLQLLDTTCEDAAEIQFFFLYEKERLMKAMRNNPKLLPMILINSLGMMWIIEFEKDMQENILRIFVMGPVFIESVTEKKIEMILVKMKLSPASRQMFYSLLEKLPVSPLIRFQDYGVLLHYSITGEKINVSDMIHIPNERGLLEFDQKHTRNAHTSWAQEQQLLKLMEEGSLDYRNFACELSNVGFFSENATSRQSKDAIIIHVALCTRAAIRGGLDPEVAYTLSDN